MPSITRLTHLSTAISLALLAAPALPQPADFPIKEAAEAAAIGALAGVELSGTVVGLTSVDPLTMFIADAASYSAGLALKYFEAPLVPPPSRSLFPSTGDDCYREFELNQFKAPFSNLFGLLSFGSVISNTRTAFDGVDDPGLVFNPVTGIPNNWGELGTPDIYHASTDVVLIARNSTIRNQFYDARCTSERIASGQCAGDGSDGNEFGEWEREPVTVRFPAGNHSINWEAYTLIDPVFDLGVSTLLTASGLLSKYRSGELAASLAGDAGKAKKAAADGADEGFFANKYRVKKEACTGSLGKNTICGLELVDYSNKVFGWSPFSLVTAVREREQDFVVYDVHTPTLDILQPTLTLEAADFGGTFLARVQGQVFGSVEADDACERPVGLSNDLPSLLPLGITTVQWTASDAGPAPGGGKNTVSKTQTIIVEDTQPPIIVPPPGRVIEVDPADNDDSDGRDATGVDPNILELGQPLVVDLADPMPTVGSDAPEFFPVDTRTEVTWSATDHGYPTPNTSTATQLITVKKLGTNTAPTVGDEFASTLTSQPVDIVLSGVDNDELGGRFDPLGFSITDRPDSGEFIAPLLPYFIEDYRTSPAGPYGEEFFLSGNRTRWLYDNVCRDPALANVNQKIRRDWVNKPRFVQVTDEGTLFMIDSYSRCNPSDATGGGPRISKWTRDGEYLGQIDYGGTTDAFVLDQDNFIYTLGRQGAGSSSTLTLAQVRPDFDVPGVDKNGDAWRFDFNSTGDVPVSNSQYSYARVDSRRGLIYVNDRRRIFVYDVRADLADEEDTFRNGMEDYFVGALNNGEEVIGCTSFGSSWTGFAMEVDSEGSLYVADTCADRIHKFAVSGFDENDEFVPGEYIGWMGRCDSSDIKACDVETGASKGYSCTDQTCTVSQSEGPDEGQFNTPVYLALDPNDILYVADTANQRIQRFSSDGSFAGVAESTGTGVNQGDNPSFILGNIGPPKAVSVNSTQFFVVDVDESFIHVFETSPFKDISDDSATVTYVSEFDFHSGEDSFSYRASDGLDESNDGVVTIRVDRNFRPPTVEAIDLLTDEDEPVDVVLEGDDPDGIIGRDFNGLDTLSFRVVEEPANGVLTGLPPDLSYRPDPDYHGVDRFSYVANDQRDDSEPGEVTITIAPVDDPVRVTELKPPMRAGAGFPSIFMGSYFDDGAVEHNARVDWGDGVVDVTGDFVDPDGDGELPPVLDGVMLVEPPNRDGNGMVVANHIWDQPANYALEYCMDDGVDEDCDSRVVSVERLANVAIGFAQDLAETRAATFELDLMVMNARPRSWDGFDIEDVSLTPFDSELVEVRSVEVLEGAASCVLAEELRCEVSRLPVGTNLRLKMQVAPVRAPVYQGAEVFFGLELQTATASVQEFYLASKNISFDVDAGDADDDGMSNQFENVYGLNPQDPGDAEGDLDGDKLSNLEEFDARTNPDEADTDGDGTNDGIDPDPLDPEVGLEFAPGDLNQDGLLNAADILLLQRTLRGEYTVLDASADINGDSAVDAADLLQLQREVGKR